MRGPVNLASGRYILNLAAASSYLLPFLRLSLELDGVMAASTNTFDIPILPNVLELRPKAHLLTGFSITFLVLVWTSLACRVYVRVFTIKAIGWDDATLIMSSVSLRDHMNMFLS